MYELSSSLTIFFKSSSLLCMVIYLTNFSASLNSTLAIYLTNFCASLNSTRAIYLTNFTASLNWSKVPLFYFQIYSPLVPGFLNKNETIHVFMYYCCMQDKACFYVNMQHIYVNMPLIYVNMQHNYVDMQHVYILYEFAC